MNIRDVTRTATLAVVAALLLGGAQECDTSSGSGKARDGVRSTKANLTCSIFSKKLKANANGSGYPPGVEVSADFEIEGPGNFTVGRDDVPGFTNGVGSWSTMDLSWDLPENGGGTYRLTVTAYVKGKYMGSDTDRCTP